MKSDFFQVSYLQFVDVFIFDDFYLWNTGLVTGMKSPSYPHPLPPTHLKFIWQFFPKLFLPRKHPLNFPLRWTHSTGLETGCKPVLFSLKSENTKCKLMNKKQSNDQWRLLMLVGSTRETSNQTSSFSKPWQLTICFWGLPIFQVHVVIQITQEFLFDLMIRMLWNSFHAL